MQAPQNPLRPSKMLINLRVSARVKNLIDHAAQTLGKSRSEFMLDAARHAADNAMLDRVLIRLDSQQYDAFIALIDAPPKPNKRLKRLLKTPAPWDPE